MKSPHKIIEKIRYRLKLGINSFNRFTSHFVSTIRHLSNTLAVLTFIASLVSIIALTIYTGFDHDSDSSIMLTRLMRASQITFIINVIFNLLFLFRETIRETKIIKWVVDIAILVSLLPLIYPHPENPWFPWLEQLLYSKKFLFAVIGAYSIVDVSYGVMKIMSKRTNPSTILAISFLIFIIIGACLLMMPKCTYNGINFIDSLFVSTSAVCITGLTPIDISQTLTPLGLLVLAVLIQTGGLGVMTFTSLFALFFSGNTSIYSQLMVKDMVYSKTFNALGPTLLYIFGFTIVIELVGALAIFASIHGTLGMSFEDELIFSGFHSLSAFCNAGFSNIEGGLSNPALLHHNQTIYIIASFMILAGGIGFPILVNFKTAFFRYLRRMWRVITGRRRVNEAAHIYDMNTKIVLSMTLILVVTSSALFMLMEYNNSLAGLSLSDKIVQSVFNSFVPRSSGFSSLNPAGFLNITLLMMIVLMWIGGASQSTAGGIKVNTFAAMMLNLRATVTGQRYVTAFHRNIAVDSLRRANAVVTLSIITYVVYSMLMLALEPDLPVKALLYETASALFTVGSSLGITDQLDTGAKILLCTAMFIGRVGVISLLTGIAGSTRDSSAKFPSDNIIIN